MQQYFLMKIFICIDFYIIKVYINFIKQRGDAMAVELLPGWMTGLEEEDLTFVKKFILASGSLKEVAALYGVSYPTVRLRLDRLIQKIQISETEAADDYVALVKRLAVDDKLDVETAKVLIGAYRNRKGNG